MTKTEPSLERTWDNTGDLGYFICTDSFGNVYVCGTTASLPGPYSDIVTLKYDANGNLLWQITMPGPSWAKTDLPAWL